MERTKHNSIPTEQEYHLKCKIVVKEISYNDIQSQGSLGVVTRKIVCLVPIDCSETYRFLSAWMGMPGKIVEVCLRIDHPFHQYARGAVMHPNTVDPEQSHLDEHHIFLMSYGLSQIMIGKAALHDREIEVVVLPESEDHPDGSPADHADAGDDLLTFDKKEVRTGFEA